MLNGDVWFELKELKQTVGAQNKLIQSLFSMVNPKNDMWDDQDMIQNWNMSKRTLADWRAKGLISYVQVGHKIWYPREARELFIVKNLVKTKGENE